MAINEVKAILTAEDKNYTSTMKNAMGITESFGSKVKSGIGFGAFMRIGQKAVDAVAGSIKNNLAGAVKRLDTLNNFPRVMQSLGFSAEDANKGINKLADNITHLPATLDSVAQQAQAIVPLTNNIDKATDVVLALNNAMAAGGAEAAQQTSAINQWTQAMSKGKPDMQDWKSIIQTAPAQMDQLAKAMLGATANQSDLYSAMQSGSITMDQVNDKMIELTNASEGFDIAGKHYDNFKVQAENASAGIQTAFTNAKNAITRNLANIIGALDQRIDISGIIKSFKPVADGIGKMLTDAISAKDPAQGFADMFDKIGKKSKELIPMGMNAVGNFIEGMGQALPTLIPAGIRMVGDIILGILQGIPDLIVSGLNLITSVVEGIGQGEGDLINKVVQIVKTIAVGFAKALPQIALAAGKLVIALAKALVGAIPKILSAAWKLVKQIPAALLKSRDQTAQAAISVINRLWTGLKSAFSSIPARVAALARKIPKAIKSGIGNLLSVGRDLIQGLWKGISAKFDTVIGKVKAKAAKLPKAVKKVLGIASPSKVMKKLGEYTGEGFAIGIENSYRQVQSAMAGIASVRPQTALAGNMGLSMSDDYMYNVSARYEVVVPLTLNGREIARASASDMQTAINQIENRQSRKVGIR